MDSKTNQSVMITCAVVGAELTREQTPYLPLTPEEIATAAVEAHEAGAAIIHLHVRDEKGRPTCREDVFQKVISKIRSQCSAILQVSTGGAVGDREEDRLRPLGARPDMASLTTGSINFGTDVFLNRLPFVEQLARKMKELKIKPEIEVFDAAMLERGVHLAEQGLIEWPLHFDWVLGVPGGLAATERNLDFLISGLPDQSTWTLAAIGRHQFPMVELALRKGGHVRVGMEDNIYLEKGVLAPSNAQLVQKAVEMARLAGRSVAGSEEAREILCLESESS